MMFNAFLFNFKLTRVVECECLFRLPDETVDIAEQINFAIDIQRHLKQGVIPIRHYFKEGDIL
jgi:hypothetical protein